MTDAINQSDVLREAILEWCASETSANVVIAAGYEGDEFATALISPKSKQLGMLTTPQLANSMQERADKLHLPAPLMRNAERLDREFSQYRKKGSSKIIAVPFEITGKFIVNEVERLAKHQTLLFDITPSKPRILHHLIVALRQEIEKICNRGAVRMILHDPTGEFLIAADSAADLIVPDGFAYEATYDAVNARLDEEWDEEREVQLTIAAREIVEADSSALRASLRFPTFPSVQSSIWRDWLMDMEKLANSSEDVERRAIGQAAVGLLSLAMNTDAAQQG